MKLATLCYVRDGDRTLMIHRNKKENDIHEGKRNGLGGKLEEGETPEACAIREVYEESGLTVSNPVMKGVLTFPDFNGGESRYVFLFLITEFVGELRDSEEGELHRIQNGNLRELNTWEGDDIFMGRLEQDRFFSGRFVYADGRLVDHDISQHC